MSTYKGEDDCTDIILDFIAGGAWGDALGNKIGESDGDYNAYFGHTHPKSVEFSKMSLAKVYDFQSSMLRYDPRSSALGRYQFLNRTLRVLAAKRGLSDGTLFTNRLQDQLAVDLLKGRGYQAWWRGDISDDEFAHNLSLEWASLPDPDNGGRSHYDGDSAGNHASTSLANVRAMLKRARAAIKK